MADLSLSYPTHKVSRTNLPKLASLASRQHVNDRIRVERVHRHRCAVSRAVSPAVSSVVSQFLLCRCAGIKGDKTRPRSQQSKSNRFGLLGFLSCPLSNRRSSTSSLRAHIPSPSRTCFRSLCAVSGRVAAGREKRKKAGNNKKTQTLETRNPFCHTPRPLCFFLGSRIKKTRK